MLGEDIDNCLAVHVDPTKRKPQAKESYMDM